jgi:ABC-type enterobactin transport system permease subunit
MKEEFMQMAITFMAVVGGLVFSLAIALLAEELIFGQVFRLFFARRRLAVAKVVVPLMAIQTVPAEHEHKN